MFQSRTLQSCALSLVAIGGGIALAFAPKLVFPGPHPGADPAFVLTSTGCMALAVGWSAWFSIASFRRADEFVQTRSQFAWYWGSMSGLITMAPLFGFAMLGGLTWIAPDLVISRGQWLTFAAGMLTPLTAQMIGFAAVSAWWRANKQ